MAISFSAMVPRLKKATIGLAFGATVACTGEDPATVTSDITGADTRTDSADTTTISGRAPWEGREALIEDGKSIEGVPAWLVHWFNAESFNSAPAELRQESLDAEIGQSVEKMPKTFSLGIFSFVSQGNEGQAVPLDSLQARIVPEGDSYCGVEFTTYDSLFEPVPLRIFADLMYGSSEVALIRVDMTTVLGPETPEVEFLFFNDGAGIRIVSNAASSVGYFEAFAPLSVALLEYCGTATDEMEGLAEIVDLSVEEEFEALPPLTGVVGNQQRRVSL